MSESTKKKTFYHKASVTGLIDFITNFETESRICVSTDNSAHLFWRDVCLVLKANTENVVAEHTEDIDAHSVTAHDESRLVFKSKKEFIGAIEYIIIDGNILRTIKAGKFESPEALVSGELAMKFFTGRNHDEAQRLAIAEFYKNNKTTTLSVSKKINKNWTRAFLNM